jgi:alanyl-tRNA synthetase
VLPSNEGRGYVLRRIIRRAIRHGHKLGIKRAFFHKLVAALEREMGAAYPELTREARASSSRCSRRKKERFAETLEPGHGPARTAIANLAGDKTRIDGETVFKLYDTYGFPVDLTADIARERGPHDRPGRLRGRDGRAARTRARGQQASAWTCAAARDRGARTSAATRRRAGEGRVVALLRDGAAVDALRPASAASRRARCARRSTPSPAARSAMPASSRAGGLRFIVATRRSAALRIRTSAARRGPRSVGAAAVTRASMRSAARTPLR